MNVELEPLPQRYTLLAPTEAVKLASARLPEMVAKTQAFGRSNSQTTTSLVGLTMLTGQAPHRQVRQVLAEIAKRQAALAEAQVSYVELVEKEPEQGDSETLHKAKQRLKSFQLQQMENHISGAVKDIAVLIAAYDNLVAAHGMENWTEEDFESHENKFHVRRGFELLYRNLVELGRAKEASIEYLQQFGVHIQIALREVAGYIATTNERISNGDRPTAADLEDFLDHMALKYEYCVVEVTQRMFGVESITKPEFMSLTKLEA
jgi:hypothetical protein